MKKLIPIIYCIVVTVACSTAQSNEKENITCQQAFDLIQENQDNTDFVILDLRPESMHNAESIKNSIFYDVFSEGFEQWIEKFDREKTYLLYCTKGHRSGIALNKMKEMGFANLYHLYEGIIGWKEQGYEIVKN